MCVFFVCLAMEHSHECIFSSCDRRTKMNEGWGHNYKTSRQLKPASGVATMAETVLKDTFLLRIRTNPPRTHPDLRASCQLTRTNTLKTGVMRSASVIKWKEGNEVTVDSQFSQRKLAFIAHLILGSKQVSCLRLSRGIWQLLLKPSSWCGDEKETAKINGIRRVGGEGRKHINQEGRSNSPSCVSVTAQERKRWVEKRLIHWLRRFLHLFDAFGICLLQPDSFTFTHPSVLPSNIIFLKTATKHKAVIKCRAWGVLHSPSWEWSVCNLVDIIDLLSP